jgi:hypothetical protein
MPAPWRHCDPSGRSANGFEGESLVDAAVAVVVDAVTRFGRAGVYRAVAVVAIQLGERAIGAGRIAVTVTVAVGARGEGLKGSAEEQREEQEACDNDVFHLDSPGWLQLTSCPIADMPESTPIPDNSGRFR